MFELVEVAAATDRAAQFAEWVATWCGPAACGADD